jgi:hypothetical protein
MKYFVIISFICYQFVHNVQAQTPKSQTFIFAGLPAAGFDYSRKISRKKWSSSALSITASPTFYFRKYNFDLEPGRSTFTHSRILVPVTLRLDIYVNQIIKPSIGKKTMKVGVFLDAGYCVSYTLKAQLHEELYSSSKLSAPDFIFNGSIASGSEKLSFHPTIGFGMRFGRALIYFRAIVKPYQSWRDRSKDWELSKGQTSYFYSWEYNQTGAMVCFGFQL